MTQHLFIHYIKLLVEVLFTISYFRFPINFQFSIFPNFYFPISILRFSNFAYFLDLSFSDFSHWKLTIFYFCNLLIRRRRKLLSNFQNSIFLHFINFPIFHFPIFSYHIWVISRYRYQSWRSMFSPSISKFCYSLIIPERENNHPTNSHTSSLNIHRHWICFCF